MDDIARILLRLPTSLHRSVKGRAAQTGVSVNAVLVQAIEDGLSMGPEHQWVPVILETAKAQLGEKFLGLLLYGSKARGDAYKQSDTDLLLVVEPSVHIERSLYREWDKRLPENLSLNIAHLPKRASEAGSLWLECALDAKILHDPSGRLRTRLSEIRDLILSGSFVRKTTHGQGYWLAK